LLIVGERGLAEAKQAAAYQPAQFIGTLTLAMLLSLADTMTLLLFAAIHLEDGKPEALLLVACAAGLVGSFIGLYRLRAWGLVANVITNVVIAFLALVDAFDLPDGAPAMIVATAALQLVVPFPIVYSIVRGRPLELKIGARTRRIVGYATIVTTALVAVVASWVNA
jgi:hypothetical protein